MGRAMRSEPLRDAEQEIEDWNNQNGPGSEVTLTDDFGVEHRTRTRSVAWLVGGRPLVLVEGRTGGYDLRRIRAGWY